MKLIPKILLVIILTFCINNIYAEDWFTWRGPDRNGISNETGLNFKSIQNNTRINWTKELGKGYSSVAVRGNYLYTMGYEGRGNVIYCLDAKTGNEVWK